MNACSLLICLCVGGPGSVSDLVCSFDPAIDLVCDSYRHPCLLNGRAAYPLTCRASSLQIDLFFYCPSIGRAAGLSSDFGGVPSAQHRFSRVSSHAASGMALASHLAYVCLSWQLEKILLAFGRANCLWAFAPVICFLIAGVTRLGVPCLRVLAPCLEVFLLPPAVG